jgi:tetratricopeptide (TPR) repeat protein
MPVKKNSRKKAGGQQDLELDVKIQFMEGLIRRDPEFVDALRLLGDHYTQRGRFVEGLEVDQKLSLLEPRNPFVFYNLACSYSLIGKLDEAADALHKAIRLGYRDFRWLAKDPDLGKLRKHPLYRRIQDEIRRMNVKVR